MNKFFTIFSFYFKEGIKTKSTIITMAILFLLSFGAFSYQYFTKDDNSKSEFLVINQSKEYNVPIETINKTLKDAKVKEKDVSIKELKKQIEDGDIDGAIVVTKKNDMPNLQYYYKSFPDQATVTIVSQMIQNEFIGKTIETYKVPKEAAEKMVKPIEIENKVINDTSKTFAIVYVFIFLMYFFIIFYGQSIAMSITSEKSSRVMEVLLPKVKPIVMMYAKILSVMSFGLVQFAAIAAGFIASNVLGFNESGTMMFFGGAVDLSTITPFLIAMFFVYFILGFMLYAILYASVGAMVSRTEDLQSVITPVVFCLLGAFMIGMQTIFNPETTLATVSSYIPVFSPIVTFSRIVSGVAGPVEIGISITILVVTIMILNKLASRIYVNGVMHYSEKVSWKEIGRFMKKQ